MTVLSELRNRGVEDVCIVACDGLKGLPDAITATWPKATVRTCVIHLILASLRFASKQHHAKLVTELKAIYTAPRNRPPSRHWPTSPQVSLVSGIPRSCGPGRPPGASSLPTWPSRRISGKVVYSTNLIESINARLRKATRNRGYFPSEQAALEVLYLAVFEDRLNAR
ncbi:transposase [Streptomyces rectiverticillatus]|uniref:transposase n=1 Tax=Streptomyces rectiverticillatus TaxID=173860 RepID=UPI0024837090|nr:transposase [Streptomyces rectiverticillatus]